MPVRIALAALVILFSFTSAAIAEPPSPPGAKDRCAVCGMFVAPYPDWISVIEFKDGTKAYFDGPKDMFVYFFDLAKYRPGAKNEDIADMYVTEYYSTQLLSIGEVFLVTGSEVTGPMGYELVPVKGRENAETFLKDHGGKKIMRFNGQELTDVTSAP